MKESLKKFWGKRFPNVVSRKEFWQVTLVNVLTVIGSASLAVVTSSQILLSVFVCYLILLVVPTVRYIWLRLKDTGRTWKSMAWLLLPYIGWLYLCVLLTLPSSFKRKRR